MQNLNYGILEFQNPMRKSMQNIIFQFVLKFRWYLYLNILIYLLKYLSLFTYCNRKLHKLLRIFHAILLSPYSVLLKQDP